MNHCSGSELFLSSVWLATIIYYLPTGSSARQRLPNLPAGIFVFRVLHIFIRLVHNHVSIVIENIVYQLIVLFM